MKFKKENNTRRYVWVDQYGIIGHAYPGGVEGGDSVCWNGHYKYFSEIDDGVSMRETFEVAFGGYVRHPHHHPIYNRFGSYYENAYMGVISRDQKTGVLLGLIAEKDRIGMLRLIANWALKGFLFSNNVVHNGVEPSETKFNLIKFFYNPEDKEKGIKRTNHYHIPGFTGPNMWQMALRGFGVFSWLFWPILFFLDLHILLDTGFENADTDDDSINYLGRLHVAKTIVPTPISWLAVKLLDKEELKQELATYWIGWRDNPGMYDIHAKAIDAL